LREAAHSNQKDERASTPGEASGLRVQKDKLIQGGKLRSAIVHKPADQFAFEREQIRERAFPVLVTQGKAVLKIVGNTKWSLDLSPGRQRAGLRRPGGRRRRAILSSVTQAGQAATQ
jgi:hypothetical protein